MTQVIDQFLGEIRGAGTLTGTALTTTIQTIPLPLNTKWVSWSGRNYVTGVVAQVIFGPWATVLLTADNNASVADYSDAVQDADAATDLVLSSMDTLANGDALYIGSVVPFRGFYCDIDAANGTASVLLAEYWNGSAWTTLSATDGTAAAGATFAVDGSVSWTMPTAGLWQKAVLNKIVARPDVGWGARYQQPLYWTRVTVSVALDTSTTLNGLGLLNQSTNYSGWVTGQVFSEAIPGVRGGTTANLNVLMDAGTGNLVVNVAGLGEL